MSKKIQDEFRRKKRNDFMRGVTEMIFSELKIKHNATVAGFA